MKASKRSEQYRKYDDAVSAENAVGINQITKLKQQYNVTLEWKHLSSQSFNVLAGIGFSSLLTSTDISLDDSENYGIHNTGIVASQKKFLYGAQLKVGVEYLISAHSGFTVNLSYFMYAPTKLNDFSTFYAVAIEGDADDSDPYEPVPALLRKRKTTINFLAFGAGYTYHF